MAADYIMTIDDEAATNIRNENSDESDKTPTKSYKRSSKVEEFNPLFSFVFEDKDKELPLDFTLAKQSLRNYDDLKSVDEKVKKCLDLKKLNPKPNKAESETSILKSNGSTRKRKAPRDERSSKRVESNGLITVNTEKTVNSGSVHDSISDNEKEFSDKRVKEFFGSIEISPIGSDTVSVSWTELGLSRGLLRAIDGLGYKFPTPVQARTIPMVHAGHDICASAVTGSGKTAAFVLPLLQRLLPSTSRHRLPASIRALILLPTRELAVQCHSVVTKLAQYTDIRCCLVVGGLSNQMQQNTLRTVPDIVVATPGRLIDHLRNSQSVGLEDLEVLIFDEADRLLELGFTAEVEEIVKNCPKGRQTLLFSATMTDEVDRLVRLSLNKPVRIVIDPVFATANTLSQEFIKVKSSKEADREAMLMGLCAFHNRRQNCGES